jgi:3D (Asp-Asp-Asp) domain-containing protein
VRGRRETRRAPAALVLVGLTAALVLPAARGADPSADALRARQSSLGDRVHTALLGLYSLDTRLAQSRVRLASLTRAAESVRAQLSQIERDEHIARRSWRASVAALDTHLRSLYEQGQPDAIGILLGASSIDDAMTRLDELERAANLSRDTIAQTRNAQTMLARVQGELEARAQRLHDLVAATEQTTETLAQARAARSAYIASLARQRAFTAHEISRLAARAHASAARSPAPAAASAPPTAAATVAAPATPAPATSASGSTLTVTSTGYSMSGRTATGLPVGWGVVAVDPTVIPLGTRMTIPGYGEGVAADTGSAVQGATIDLWFPTQAQAMAWGRRTIMITLH